MSSVTVDLRFQMFLKQRNRCKRRRTNVEVNEVFASSGTLKRVELSRFLKKVIWTKIHSNLLGLLSLGLRTVFGPHFYRSRHIVLRRHFAWGMAVRIFASCTKKTFARRRIQVVLTQCMYYNNYMKKWILISYFVE